MFSSSFPWYTKVKLKKLSSGKSSGKYNKHSDPGGWWCYYETLQIQIQFWSMIMLTLWIVNDWTDDESHMIISWHWQPSWSIYKIISRFQTCHIISRFQNYWPRQCLDLSFAWQYQRTKEINDDIVDHHHWQNWL